MRFTQPNARKLVDFAHATDRLISGCVRMTCVSLLITSHYNCKWSIDLLQVDCQNLLSAGLLQVLQQIVTSDKLQKSDVDRLAAT